MKRSINKSFFNWLLVLGWIGMIYYFSDQPNLQSGLQPLWDLVLRKIAHMAEYFVLAYLLWRAISVNGERGKYSLFLAMGLALMYAIFDEWHQQSVVGRHGSIVDVLIDLVGIVTFGLMYKLRKFMQII